MSEIILTTREMGFGAIKRPVSILYIALALTGSFASGLLFQAWLA